MNNEHIYKIIQKILGEIEPVGESNEDDKRLVNLKNTIDVVYRLISDIENVANDKDRVEYSIKKAGKIAYDFRNSLTEYDN